MPHPDHAPGEAALALAVAGVSLFPGAIPRLRYRRVGDAYAGDRDVHGALVGLGEAATVGFAWAAAGPVDFIELEVPILPGRYCVEDVSLQGRRIDDLQRRVMRVRDRQADTPADALWLVADAGRALFELDVRGLPGHLDTDVGTLAVEVVIRREAPGIDLARQIQAMRDALSEQASRLARDAAGSAYGQGAALRQLAMAQAGLQRAVGGASDLQQRQLDEMALRLGGLEEGLTALGPVAGQVTALVPVPGGIERLQDGLAQLVERVGALHRLQEQALAGAVTQSAALAALREQMQRMDAELGRVRLGIENVFWRRWLRRLRGGTR